jgi:uncharacterized protein YpbB
MGLLVWMNNGDDGKELYQKITGARVAYEIYNRLSGQRDIDTYQAQCYMGIAEFIKKHPKASEQELTEEVQKQIALFAAKVEAS